MRENHEEIRLDQARESRRILPANVAVAAIFYPRLDRRGEDCGWSPTLRRRTRSFSTSALIVTEFFASLDAEVR